LDLVIETKQALDRMVFTDVTLCSVFTANSRLATVVSVKFAAQTRVCTVLCKTPKQAVNLSVHQDGTHPSTGIREILDVKAASVVQQVYKVLGGIENLAGCTMAKVGESSE
jgi:hypothetical protein